MTSKKRVCTFILGATFCTTKAHAAILRRYSHIFPKFPKILPGFLPNQKFWGCAFTHAPPPSTPVNIIIFLNCRRLTLNWIWTIHNCVCRAHISLCGVNLTSQNLDWNVFYILTIRKVFFHKLLKISIRASGTDFQSTFRLPTSAKLPVKYWPSGNPTQNLEPNLYTSLQSTQCAKRRLYKRTLIKPVWYNYRPAGCMWPAEAFRKNLQIWNLLKSVKGYICFIELLALVKEHLHKNN